MRIAILLILSLLIGSSAGTAIAADAAGTSVSTQTDPEHARKFDKTEFDAVITSIKKDKQAVTVRVDGIEYRLKAPMANLAFLKTGDKVKVYLRNKEDKEAW